MTAEAATGFDYKREVDAAFRDHPALRKNTLFILTKVEDGMSVNKVSGNWGLRLKTHLTPVAAWLQNTAVWAHQNDMSAAYKNDDYKIKALIFKDDESYFDKVPAKWRDTARTFAFFHELGHLMVQEGFDVTEDKPYGECYADAFATIRCIQKFGADDGFLDSTAWARAYKFIHYNSSTHLTTTVIDKILEDSKTRDFSKLTPAETVEAAAQYARDNMPSVVQIATAKKNFKPLSGLLKYVNQDKMDRLQTLASTTLAAGDRFTFYIGARAFQPFLNPEGVELNGSKLKLDFYERTRMSQDLPKRAERMGFDALAQSTKEKAKPAKAPPVLKI
ncbi:MAG: hypothetical protein ACAH80_05285 [Alphaproteobacteria bacterium]